ncbi:DUF4352 domain-containing protein [Bacillus sp. FJAT-45350]|uniref:DUF4352 domain-containing protein n=1 Tax=Bacillus sp. FJAT-45350 TaxID=2011014 RepID=UPI000BB7830E|nr:DUF4352 domain-containing protein [Bacillus sp. FJAT-45350]
MNWKIGLLTGLNAILFMLIGYWLGNSYPLGGEATSNEVHSSGSKNTQYEIGDEVEINGLSIMVHGVKYEEQEQDGNQFVIVDVTVANNKQHIYEFTPYKMVLMDPDGYGYDYDSRIETKGILGGQIGPGRKVRGELGFYVPTFSEYEFIYTDHLRTGQVVWNLKENKKRW